MLQCHELLPGAGMTASCRKEIILKKLKCSLCFLISFIFKKLTIAFLCGIHGDRRNISLLLCPRQIDSVLFSR